MPKVDKKARQEEAARRDMPLTVLLCIQAGLQGLLRGLDGEETLRGVRIPAIELDPTAAKWTRLQAAKVTRWAAEAMQAYGWNPAGPEYANNAAFREANKKLVYLGERLKKSMPPDMSYLTAVIIQLSVLELCWQGIITTNNDHTRASRTCLRTLRTLDEKFIEPDSREDEILTEVFMDTVQHIKGVVA